MVLGELPLDLTLVIPTRNREESLRRLLGVLDCADYEILVVDDQSEPPVKLEGVRIIRNEKRMGSGMSWNIGSKFATGRWLLLTADDLFPSADFIPFVREILPKLSADHVVGFRIGGSTYMGSSQVRIEGTTLHRMADILFGVDLATVGGASKFVPGAMLFPKELYLSIGGFDSRTFAGTGFREESDLQWRARRRGAKIYYVEEPHFEHSYVRGGHSKKEAPNMLSHFRNQTRFALRTMGFVGAVPTAAYATYLLLKGARISDLVKGTAMGLKEMPPS